MSQLTIQQTFAQALQHHRAGRLQEAERLYRHILAQRPDHAGAMHFLGVIAQQLGRNDDAVDLFRRVVALRPKHPEAHNSLGNALRNKGQLDEAVAACRQAIVLRPDYAEAHSNLGAALGEKGRLNEAVVAFRQAIAIKPDYPEAYYNLCNALAGKGQLDEAIAAGRQAISLRLNYPEAHNSLGNVLKDNGQLDEAVTAFRQAITLMPNFTEAHYNLGIALKDKGSLDEAIASYRQAISLRPSYAEAHINLGVALYNKGQFDEAIAAYRQGIALRPNFAEGHYNLGISLVDKGQLDEAIAAYRQAIAIRPNYPEAYSNLGIALKDQGHLDNAITAYRQATALRPNYAEAQGNLGKALAEKGQLDEAIAACRQAIAINPKLAEPYNSLGAIWEQMGDFQEAERCYRQAIDGAENNAGSHASLARLLGRRLPDKDLTALEALAADPSVNVTNQSPLHFGLAHVLDARECYQEAAEHLRVANALCKADAEKKGQGYDIAMYARFVTRMIETCSTEFFQHVKGMGIETQRPVFIIGLPRSGTTLTEQILAGHSQVFGAGELQLGHGDFQLLAGESVQTLHPSVREEIPFKNLSRIDREALQRIARQHLLQLDKLNSSAPRIVDKMPGNYQYLGLLAALFPQARFIHCRRDLRDVAISCWMMQFSSIPWSNDLEHITTRFEQYRRLMQHWGTVLNGRWLDCDYEQTVTDVPVTARRLVDWCGLEWEPACVDFHLVKRPVRTASVTQVRQPISKRSVGRWKHYQETLAPVLDRLQ